MVDARFFPGEHTPEAEARAVLLKPKGRDPAVCEPRPRTVATIDIDDTPRQLQVDRSHKRALPRAALTALACENV